MKRSIAVTVAALAALAACAAPARADERFFAYTYDWFTPEKGDKEAAFWWTQGEGGNVDAQLQFEYGVTDRYSVSPFLMVNRAHGGDWEVEGWKLEQRYRFGEYKKDHLLPGAFLAVEKKNHGPWALEGNLITTYEAHQGWVWAGNLIFKGPVEDDADLELGYSTGVSFKVTDRFRAGFELFGQWEPEGEHFAGPAVRYVFDHTSWVVATLGLKYEGESGGAVRVLFEKA